MHSDEDAKLGRAIAGGHIQTIAKAVIHHSELCEAVFELFFGQIEAECTKLCRKTSPSLFRKLTARELMEFEWERMIAELEERAPLFIRIYSSIVSINDHRNQKKSRANHYPALCMATAVLLKERNREMCGVQSVLSLLLFSSHAEKKVAACTYTLNSLYPLSNSYL